MILSATSHLIEIVTDATATTNEMQWNSYYADNTTTAFTPGASSGLTTGATAATIVSSPASSTQRQVKYISIFNNDTVAHLTTVRFDDGTNERILVKILLQVGETLEYNQSQGWRVLDPYGIRKEGTMLSMPKPFAYENMGFNAANISATRTLTSTSSFAQYLGRAEYGYTQCLLRYRTTTAAATVTWAEVAIASGTFAIGANQSLTTRGFTSATGNFTATAGIKQNSITLTGISAGMDLWAILGNEASTAAVVRAGLADNLQSGFASAATARPSTMSANTTFTLSADTDAMLWLACSFS